MPSLAITSQNATVAPSAGAPIDAKLGSDTESRRTSGPDTDSWRNSVSDPDFAYAPSSFEQSRFVSFFSSAYFAADALIIGPMIFMSDS